MNSKLLKVSSFIIVSGVILSLVTSCKTSNIQDKAELKTTDSTIVKETKKEQKSGTSMISLETNYGAMEILLYNETPLHKANILKLVKENFYDSLLFHRVIKGFMIQAGDPDSKGAEKGKMLGMGGPGYTVPAEFNPKFIHKKGAISAARMGDAQNPLKASSGSQFYIVQGSVLTDAQLDQVENSRIEKQEVALIREFLSKAENSAIRDKVMLAQQERNEANFNAALAEAKAALKPQIDEIAGKYKYTAEQREIYKTIGGAPHLDFDYTVYGEVTSGLDVIDKIANVETDRNDRPNIDIVMKMTVKK